jgi:hypothetical protein
MYARRVSLALTIAVWFSVLSFSMPPQEEPTLSTAQMREFLLNAKVIANKRTSKGITSPYRLTLSDGNLTHDAGFQSIDERVPRKEFANHTVEINFVDSYKYDIAAYELAVLLGLGDMMPVTVQRRWDGKTGAISWWLPVMMDEATRLSKHMEPPDPDAWNKQMYKKRIFAELVYDTDPNLTNVLISKDWHLWMIDFSRAFRLYKQLRLPDDIRDSKCARQLLDKLRKLDRAEFTLKTKGILSKGEIDGVMGRRDKIVAMYDDLIAKRGEAEVLYDDPSVK